MSTKPFRKKKSVPLVPDAIYLSSVIRAVREFHERLTACCDLIADGTDVVSRKKDFDEKARIESVTNYLKGLQEVRSVGRASQRYLAIIEPEISRLSECSNEEFDILESEYQRLKQSFDWAEDEADKPFALNDRENPFPELLDKLEGSERVLREFYEILASWEEEVVDAVSKIEEVIDGCH